MNLHEAMNTYNIALHTIEECGYAIFVEDVENSDDYFWAASKNDNKISAFNP
ncbi:MAG: hypothetical protein LBI59_10920 [Candidatus Accumulibacter sp.]|jgi:hypothetical protein|nr:hypothetical protein [Accumulibacter sp.]